MEIDVTFFALAIPAVLFAGISKGGFGSGAAFAATPFLALILEPALAIGVMLPLLMMMDLGALRPYWKKWNAGAAKTLILGAIPGVLIGAAFFGVADPDVFRFLIGIIAVGFVVFQFVRGQRWLRPAKQPMSDRVGFVAGALSGFTSFISHAGGPPASIYLLSMGLSKTGYQATTVLTFWAINLMKFFPYAMLGMITKDTALANIYLAPFAFIGVALGVYAHRMVPEKLFFSLTYLFLLITGAKLIWDALS